MISSTIPAIRRKEMAPRTPPMIAVESVDGVGVDVGSEAKPLSKKTPCIIIESGIMYVDYPYGPLSMRP